MSLFLCFGDENPAGVRSAPQRHFEAQPSKARLLARRCPRQGEIAAAGTFPFLFPPNDRRCHGCMFQSGCTAPHINHRSALRKGLRPTKVVGDFQFDFQRITHHKSHVKIAVRDGCAVTTVLVSSIGQYHLLRKHQFSIDTCCDNRLFRPEQLGIDGENVHHRMFSFDRGTGDAQACGGDGKGCHQIVGL